MVRQICVEFTAGATPSAEPFPASTPAPRTSEPFADRFDLESAGMVFFLLKGASTFTSHRDRAGLASGRLGRHETRPSDGTGCPRSPGASLRRGCRSRPWVLSMLVRGRSGLGTARVHKVTRTKGPSDHWDKHAQQISPDASWSSASPPANMILADIYNSPRAGSATTEVRAADAKAGRALTLIQSWQLPKHPKQPETRTQPSSRWSPKPA